MLKPLLILILVIFQAISAMGQNITHRNDSLFINDFYVNPQITKSTLDSLLASTSKAKKSKGNTPPCPNSDKKVTRTTYFYYELGIFLRKYDCDTSKFSLGIKLYHDSDRKYDKRSGELTNTFSGELLIADNEIHDKREISELQAMDNVTVTISKLEIGIISSVIGGDIVSVRDFIRLSFDSKTDQLTHVYIHHNFRK
ncbi:MAG: hypothetical protein KF905_05475 [Flavobacteriales bacterium]|nr:hypothetical protein [Flavobacteriales bacterium]